MGIFKSKGSSNDAQKLQQLQAQQIQDSKDFQLEQSTELKKKQLEADTLKKRTDAQQQEDQSSATKRASMGILANILSSNSGNKKQTLGG